MQTMPSLEPFRHCRSCGRKYPLGGRRKTCICGGYIYVISPICQPKVQKGRKECVS